MPQTNPTASGLQQITGLILAAGSSTRFGQSNKLLEPINDKPLISYTIESLSSCDQVLVVTQEQDSDLHKVISNQNVEIAINPRPQSGISSSIISGVNSSIDSDAWCILPGDMPYVSHDTASRVVNALRQSGGIVVPCMSDRYGHPVGFSKDFKSELLALEGDRGARKILDYNSEQLTRIEVLDPGIFRDVDLPEDLLS